MCLFRSSIDPPVPVASKGTCSPRSVDRPRQDGGLIEAPGLGNRPWFAVDLDVWCWQKNAVVHATARRSGSKTSRTEAGASRIAMHSTYTQTRGSARAARYVAYAAWLMRVGHENDVRRERLSQRLTDARESPNSRALCSAGHLAQYLPLS